MGNQVVTVVKLGGSILARPELIDPVLRALARGACGRGILVLPGGGPFADAVRAADAELGLSPAAAHWMAVLAMDQFACLIADRLPEGVLVRNAHEIGRVLESGQLPVLAPSRWMLEVDPLPHTWEVTSDSIAAWVAGRVDAKRLVLVKPPGLDAALPGGKIVDGYFVRALRQGTSWVTVPADQTGRLVEILAASASGLELDRS